MNFSFNPINIKPESDLLIILTPRTWLDTLIKASTQLMNIYVSECWNICNANWLLLAGVGK